MIIVSYDIKSNKLRSNFSKFIKKFGYRLQYSVWRINNSERILNNIITEINNTYSKSFGEEDSIYIFELTNTCKIITFGYAKHDGDELIVIDR